MSMSDDAIAGAVGGMVARTIAAPFDVLKIRFQLQFGKDAKYSSVPSAFRAIVREEGVLSLWKGNLSASYLWVSYMGVQFGMYGGLKRLLSPKDKESLTPLKKSMLSFISGATAATVACASTYPFDLMRTQFVMQGNERVVPSIKEFVTQTYATRGIKGFYVGVAPAVVGITPYMGLNFSLFEKFKEIFSSKDSASLYNTIFAPLDKLIGSDIVTTSIRKGLAGGLAGGISKFIVYPLDTVKKRLQMQVLQNTVDRNSHVPKYSGIVHCLARTMKEEGMKGLYKGLAPTVLKAVVSSALTFSTYEAVKDAIQLYRHFVH